MPPVASTTRLALREHRRGPELAGERGSPSIAIERAAAVVDERREAAGCERREQRLLRRRRAPALDRERRLDVGLEQRRERSAAAAELVAAQRAREVRVRAVEHAAASRRAPRRAKKPSSPPTAREPVGRCAGAIGIGGPGAQVAIGEATNGVDDQLLIVIECEVHARGVPRFQETVSHDCCGRSRVVAPR